MSVAEGGSGSYTVVLATRPDGTVTVTAAVATGTDVAVSPGSLTFTADNWSEPQEVTVRAAEDADALADAEVTVRHAVSGYGAVTVAAVTVMIVENDTAGVAVSPTALSVAEGGSGSYTVVLATRPDGTVTVTAAVATGTDLAVSPGILTFTADNWSEPQEVTVRAAEDADALADAEVTVRHAVSGYGAVTVAAVTVMIVENDTAGVAVSPTALSVAEGGSGSYTVVLATRPDGTVTVTAAVAAGTDVTVSPESLTFTAGNWSEPQEVTVRAAEDADALADAEVTVRHAVSGYGAVTTAAAVTVTIVENDTAVTPRAVTVDIGAADLTVSFPTNAKFTVALEFTAPVTGLAVEEIEVSNGTAAKLAGGGASYTVAVTPAADFEGSVTVAIAAGAAQDGAGNGNAAASVEFAVDTRAPTVRSGATAPEDTGAGTTSGGVEYPEGSGSSAATATATVVAADTHVEGDLRLRDGSSATNGRLEVYLGGGWGDVCEDGFGDEEGEVACRQLGYPGFSQLVISLPNGSGVFLMDDVVCTGSENRLVDCRYKSEHNCLIWENVGISCVPGAPSGEPAIAGTARVGETLSADTSSIVDGDGPASLSFSYQWLADEEEIAGATGATYTLTAAEQGKRIKVRVSFTDGAGNEETVTSAATEAVAGADTHVEGDLRLRDGMSASSGRLEVYRLGRWGYVCDDYFGDVDGTVACRQLGYAGLVEVLDRFGSSSDDFLMDDVACTGSESRLIDCVFRVDFHNCQAAEAVGVFCSTGVNQAPGGAPTITGTVQVGETLSADTSSIMDGDGPESPSFSYQWLADEEAIAGATGATYTLTAAEQGKVIQVRVSYRDGAGNEETLTSAATEAVSIADEATAGVAVSAGALRVPEGGSGSYTVVLESEPAGEVTVRVTVAAGTDVTVSPESLTFTADTWSSAQRVTVRAAEDADALADAEVTVRHAVSGYGAVTAAADVAVTIAENDTAGVTVTPTGVTVLEGGSGSYTVVLESEPAGEVTVRVTVAAGTDVTVSPESLTFTADTWSSAQRVTVRAAESPESLTFTADTWSSAQRVTVRAAEDADAVADAEVTVSHAVSGYGAVTTAAAVAVTIAENDTAGVTVTPTGVTVLEGGSGSYTVVLESEPEGEVTVRVTVAAGTDVTVSPESLTFTADTWSSAQRVTVRAAEDADRTRVTVSHAVSGYGAVTAAADVAVTIAERTAGVAVSAGALRVPEGGSGSYTVVLESEPEGEVTVRVTVAAGTDVTVSPESLTFTAGAVRRG